MAEFVPNPRYRHFNQEIFTAGDYEQFVSTVYRCRKPMEKYVHPTVESTVPVEDHPRWTWDKYKYTHDFFATFEYIFHKFKKGIYVQIVNNQLQVFLPFSNVDYHNEYAASLKVDLSKHGSFEKMYEKICRYEGRPYVPNKVCWYPEMWYCNNGLVRYEFPMKENDSGIRMVHDMLETLCRERDVPDCEFFVNKRDFPILSMYGYEPYTALVPEETPLFSHDVDGYLPVLSMCTKKDHADIPIPTWEDWSRASYLKDGRTFPKSHKTYPADFCLEWTKKRRTLVFRGASTGLGTRIDTNPRFYFSRLCQDKNRCWTGTTEPYLDIGIAKWNTRPRKHVPDAFLDIPDVPTLGIDLRDALTPYEQSQYRYILHLPGHSCAYRLSLELGMGSVLFVYPSDYYLWYMHMLTPYEHYIPLSKGMDEHEVFELLQWCEDHQEDCERIARNARTFYERFLSYDAILDTLQRTSLRIAHHVRFHEHRVGDLSASFRAKEASIIRDAGNVPNVSMSDSLNDESTCTILRQTKKTIIYMDEKCRRMIKCSEDGDLGHAHAVSCILQRRVVDRGLCQQFLCSTEYDAEGQMLSMPYHGDIGVSMDQYLMDTTSFRMNQFKGIVAQIALALAVVQGRCLFVHYDLTPWNVMLYRNHARHSFTLADRRVHVQGCRYTAKMIDFEYASIIDDRDGVLVHRMKPFFLSDRHDLVTLVYNSFHILLKHQRLDKDGLDWIREVMYFLSDRRFRSVQELKRFLSTERKFSQLLLKHEAASFRPRLPRPTTTSFVDAFLVRIGYYGVVSHPLPVQERTWPANGTADDAVHVIDDANAIGMSDDGWMLVFDRMYEFVQGLENKQASFDATSDSERREWMERECGWKAVGATLSYDWGEAAPKLGDMPVVHAQSMHRYRWYTHAGNGATDIHVPLHRWVCRAYMLQYLDDQGYLPLEVSAAPKEWLREYEGDWVRCAYQSICSSR